MELVWAHLNAHAVGHYHLSVFDASWAQMVRLKLYVCLFGKFVEFYRRISAAFGALFGLLSQPSPSLTLLSLSLLSNLCTARKRAQPGGVLYWGGTMSPSVVQFGCGDQSR
jgi:hypothetical protein